MTFDIMATLRIHRWSRCDRFWNQVLFPYIHDIQVETKGNVCSISHFEGHLLLDAILRHLINK